MKYPYIGGLNSNCVTIFTGNGEGVAIKHPNIKITGAIERYWCEDEFTNITREYLEGKCVKIKSPEHSVLVQKLAFNAGFVWGGCSESVRSVSNGDFINFREYGHITFGNKAKGNEQITIPLPPKAAPKEWPQVGDDVVICDKSNLEELFRFKGKSCKVIGVAYYEGVKVLTVANKQQGIAAFNMGEWIKKPKTEAEILRDELHAHFEKYTFQDQAINELHLNFNITKKV